MSVGGARRGRAALGLVAMALAAFLAGCAPKGGPVEAKPGVETPRVGMAFDVGGRGDGTFNRSAWDGLVEAARQYGGRVVGEPSGPSFGDRLELRWLESRLGQDDRSQILQALVDGGSKLVFAMGVLYSDAVGRLARDNPGVHFVLVDGYLPDLSSGSNVTCVSFAEEQGSFLAGVLAGSSIKGNPRARLGFVGGLDAPITHRFAAGFAAGAAWVNPNLRKPGMVLSEYLGRDAAAFKDPVGARAAASLMYRGGAEIVYHAAGASGAGVFTAAREAGKLAIGVDSDQGAIYAADQSDPAARELSRLILTSMLKRVDQAVIVLVGELVAKGGVSGGYRSFDLASNGVGLAVNDWNRDRLASYRGVLDDARAQVVAGNVRVPSDDLGLAEFLKRLK